MTYRETDRIRISVNRALAELSRNDFVRQAYVSMLPSPCILVTTHDGQAWSVKIDAHGTVKANHILDWLGY